MPVFSAPTSKNASNGCAKRPLRRRSVLNVQESKLVLTRTHYVPMPCARWQGSNWCDDPNSWHDGRKAGETHDAMVYVGMVLPPRRKNTSAVHWMRTSAGPLPVLWVRKGMPPSPPPGRKERVPVFSVCGGGWSSQRGKHVPLPEKTQLGKPPSMKVVLTLCPSRRRVADEPDPDD